MAHGWPLTEWRSQGKVRAKETCKPSSVSRYVFAHRDGAEFHRLRKKESLPIKAMKDLLRLL